MSEMATKYRGVTIRYSEHEAQFIADLGDGPDDIYGHKEFEKVKKYIDGFQKRRFKPITALRRKRRWFGDFYDDSGDSPVEKITITSITEDGIVWIKNSKGRREKAEGELFKYTKANAKKIKTLRGLIAQRERLDRQIVEKWAALDTHQRNKLVRKYNAVPAGS